MLNFPQDCCCNAPRHHCQCCITHACVHSVQHKGASTCLAHCAFNVAIHLTSCSWDVAAIATEVWRNGTSKKASFVRLSDSLMRLTDADTTHIAHYDATPTLMLQLKGLKDVWLLPQEQVKYTYPYEFGHMLYRRARVNLTNPDYEKYPLARKLTPVKITLHPGDFLAFPGHVPHQPEAVTDSISISFRLSPMKVSKPGYKGVGKSGSKKGAVAYS